MTIRFEGGPWAGLTAEVDRVVGPVFAVGHEIGNHYWLDSKSDPPTYRWLAPRDGSSPPPSQEGVGSGSWRAAAPEGTGEKP